LHSAKTALKLFHTDAKCANTCGVYS